MKQINKGRGEVFIDVDEAPLWKIYLLLIVICLTLFGSGFMLGEGVTAKRCDEKFLPIIFEYEYGMSYEDYKQENSAVGGGGELWQTIKLLNESTH